MSAPGDASNFSGTITGGIQDISALLPLLGTEQCETHVGSALERGFLYSSVTPMSIFGSLGIVRAAFNILIASLNIRRYNFLGADKLRDGGFRPTGVVAPMIALDPRHSKRFLAETRLETMLANEHIDNVEDLTVSWERGIVWWNCLLVIFTLVISSAGLLPYIRIVLDSHSSSIRTVFPLGFGFPILRVVGAATCVNVAQFLIQIRILVILKTRLLFITVDRLAKEAGVDLETEINAKLGRRRAKSAWNSELASEKCIWALQRCLATHTDEESWKSHAIVKDIYEFHYHRQMDAIDARIPHWINPLLVFSLVFGCCATIVGYIGCFYLIQHSATTNGPLLWLVFEALLSVLRIFVWAINPSWDDSKGIVFKLRLASHAPLVTCNKFESDITQDGVAPLMRSNSFLEEVVAYTGPFPAFVVADIALYYILTAKGGSATGSAQTAPEAILYIVISDYKEQTSRVLFKNGHDANGFSIHKSSLEPVPGSSAINVIVSSSTEGETEPQSHFLTSDTAFMTRLEAHYDEITSKIEKRRSDSERKAIFGRTWAMQRPLDDNDDSSDPTDDKSPPVKPRREHRKSGPLTAEDIAYLRHGQIERRWHALYQQLEAWIEVFLALHTKELLQSIPPGQALQEDQSVKVMQMFEVNEAEFLLLHCRSILERLLISVGVEWDRYLRDNHDEMAKVVLEGTFESGDHHGPPTATQYRKENIRRTKMSNRLKDELKHLLRKEASARRKSLQDRVTAQQQSTSRRIQGRKHISAHGEEIMKAWKGLGAELVTELDALNPFPKEARPKATRVVSRTGFPASLSYSYSSSSGPYSFGATDSIVPDDENPLSPDSSQFSPESLLFSGQSVSTEPNSADTIESVMNRQLEYEARLEARYRDVVKEVEKYKDQVQRDKELVLVDQMNVRCQERAAQLFSRLEAQALEFKDLFTKDVLIDEKHALLDYWSNESLRERERLQDQAQKYLSITDTSVEAVGGRQNMLRALKRAQQFCFLDVHRCNLLTSEDLASIVDQVDSITGITSSKDAPEVYETVWVNAQHSFQRNIDTCYFANLIVTDNYRSGKPYLLFTLNGASYCDVYFYTQMKCDHVLTFRHCVTTSHAKLDVKLNGQKLEGSWGQSSAVRDNFTNEDIHLPRGYLHNVGRLNLLEIILDNESPGVYWLSDIFLPVQPVQSIVSSENI